MKPCDETKDDIIYEAECDELMDHFTALYEREAADPVGLAYEAALTLFSFVFILSEDSNETMAAIVEDLNAVKLFHENGLQSTLN